MSKRKAIVDIYAILQHLRAGESNRQIKKQLGVDRRTVQKYRQWAESEGLLTIEKLPPIDELQQLVSQTMPRPQAPQNRSSVAPYEQLVRQLRSQNVEVRAIWQRLQERGFGGSYSAVLRFVRKLEPKTPEVTVRVECQPGEEAQVDFGYAGYLLDEVSGRERKAWAFVMTLSWSRHQYVEFSFDQKVASWLRLHRNAFAFFGGIPERVVIDNLKAGIAQACIDDPQVQLTYRECAEHYGFLVAPCRPYTPQHKGKVEKGGIHYLKRNFLAGRGVTTIQQANQEARLWCLTTAGQRVHGTTKEIPLERFEATEQTALKPLPETPYDMAEWKTAKLHRDCHLQFDNAYYSVPFRYVGQRLRIRGGSAEVRLYTLDYQLVATHERASQPGQRQTHPAHLPPELLPGITLDKAGCEAAAADIGPATAHLVAALLSDRVIYRVPMVQRLLRLRDQVGDDRLEAACQRALTFGDPSYLTVKRILRKGLEEQPLPTEQPVPAATAFVRSAGEILGHLLEGAKWN